MDNEFWRKLSDLCDGDIPLAYRQLMAKYPKLLRRLMRSEAGDPADACVAQVELIADPAQVVAINEEARDGYVLDPDSNEFRWPRQLLVIGESGTGDYYCIDTTDEHEGVLQFHHQPVEFEVIADSLREYVNLLKNAFANHPRLPESTSGE